MMPPPCGRLLLGLSLALAALISSPATADCPFCLSLGPGGSSGPNVRWSASDSLAACAAGDTVVLAGHSSLHPHPSRLRVGVEYFTSSCDPRAGVPPDSIWLEYATASGNVVVNDKSTKVFADDTTDACGFARITVPSLSGCGQLVIYLYVSGVYQGSRVVTVRTLDSDADGRRTSADVTGLCDINYDGLTNSADLFIGLGHDQHWHRNALHGTLVRRTHLSHVRHGPGSIGGTQVFWNPSGRWLSYTIHEPVVGGPCHAYLIPSDPGIGNQPKQFTWSDTADYDPSWSPLNTEIAYGRGDYRIVRKGIPGLNADTTEKTVAVSGSFIDHGDLSPAISPNGQWVAFARLNQVTDDYHIWKAPIGGGAATQLTFTTGVADQYPNWSPDGEWITFDREIGFPNEHHSYKVKANQMLPGDTAAIAIYSAPMGTDAATPAYAPDGLIVTAGLGTHSTTVLDVRTHTLDPGLASPVPIINYPDTAFAIQGLHPVLSPRISPDGTRLALASREIWAARRNMNQPPAFNSVTSTNEGTRTVPDTAAVMEFIFEPVVFASSITVAATDPEGDPLTYRANFLEPWMTWNPLTRTLSGTPPSGNNGKVFYIKFWVTTASGGTDSFIAAIRVAITLGGEPMAARSAGDGAPAIVQLNPTRGEFAVETPALQGVAARLQIFDIAGRRIALISGPSGSPLIWDGHDARLGATAAPGIYFYRMEVGQSRRDGKIAVVR